ncbi:suppressor of SWI4 1 homolog [Ruditapes philippinarum]|uniref:suppressor of SWI4 1 homolog n=1 Tax=Ruditapes philippinarum TaxID=129788 RepID=UPI00295C3148|nr:suppressor of SWI4 1 homolog [Ruditapes philippinarum]
MAKRRKGKKKKTSKIDIQEQSYQDAPHSFVFHRGHVGRNVKQLVIDTRNVMEPFTAKNLQVKRKNVLKDFVSVAGFLHVSHFVMFTKTDVGVYLRLCRLPRGPTLTFKVHDYCLSKDVISSLRKPNLEQIQFLNHPLLVMNNFSGAGNHVKLMATMFQNMFPSINVHKVKLNDVRRCVLVSFDTDTNLIDFRHYNIKVVPVGMTRGVKKIMQAKIPNLAKYGDISEYMNRAGYSSESEVELDGPMNEVVLPQQIKSRGNIKSAKSAVRLTELGPRLKLELIKIEEGICEGQVMYHSLITKTEAELAAMKAMREKKKKAKETRRQNQQANIQKKQLEKEKHKEKSLEGIRKKNMEDEVEQPETLVPADEDDDIDYYKQEVGHLPDADSFVPGKNKRKKLVTERNPVVKKRKIDVKGKKTDNVAKGDKSSKGKREFTKGKNDRTSNDKNQKKSKTEGKTPFDIMMERKKRKKKMVEKKKNKFKGKKKKV